MRMGTTTESHEATASGTGVRQHIGPSRDRPASGPRQGTASAVPEGTGGSGVLTPEVRAARGRSICEVSSNLQPFSPGLCSSTRQYFRVETALSRSKQRTGARATRQFFGGSPSPILQFPFSNFALFVPERVTSRARCFCPQLPQNKRPRCATGVNFSDRFFHWSELTTCGSRMRKNHDASED